MSIRLVAAVLVLLAGAPAWAGPTVEIELVDDEHRFENAYPVTDQVARTLERDRAKVEQLVNKAKSDFATQLGYTCERFGKENWKVLANLRVMAVVLKDGRRSTTLRLTDERSGAFDDGDAGADGTPEPAGEPEPGGDTEE